MLNKPSDREYLAFSRLSRTDDGKILLGYLKAGLANVVDRMLTLDSDVLVRRMQGRGEAIKELVEALEISPDLVVKLENRAKSR